MRCEQIDPKVSRKAWKYAGIEGRLVSISDPKYQLMMGYIAGYRACQRDYRRDMAKKGKVKRG